MGVCDRCRDVCVLERVQLMGGCKVHGHRRAARCHVGHVEGQAGLVLLGYHFHQDGEAAGEPGRVGLVVPRPKVVERLEAVHCTVSTIHRVPESYYEGTISRLQESATKELAEK